MTIKDFLQTGRNLGDYFRANSNHTFNYMHFTRLLYAVMDDAQQKGRFGEYFYYKCIYVSVDLWFFEPMSLFTWRLFIHCYRRFHEEYNKLSY